MKYQYYTLPTGPGSSNWLYELDKLGSNGFRVVQVLPFGVLLLERAYKGIGKPTDFDFDEPDENERLE